MGHTIQTNRQSDCTGIKTNHAIKQYNMTQTIFTQRTHWSTYWT